MESTATKTTTAVSRTTRRSARSNAVSRGFIVALGICSIAWAVAVLPPYRTEALFVGIAQRILSGEKFNANQLGVVKDQVAGARLEGSVLSSFAVIRLELFEHELKAGGGQPPAMDIADLRAVVSGALAQNPTNSFMWLIGYWLDGLYSDERKSDLNLLRMSYWFGPNEAWIAAKRNPLSMRIISSLPAELAEQAILDFVGLINARLYSEAANILVGPGWVIRERLLSRLVDVDEENRRLFARALASKDVEGITVPGLSERPFRRF